MGEGEDKDVLRLIAGNADGIVYFNQAKKLGAASTEAAPQNDESQLRIK
jgi:hypothetical protein